MKINILDLSSYSIILLIVILFVIIVITVAITKATCKCECQDLQKYDNKFATTVE
jgi:hypothetical protein